MTCTKLKTSQFGKKQSTKLIIYGLIQGIMGQKVRVIFPKSSLSKNIFLIKIYSIVEFSGHLCLVATYAVALYLWDKDYET